MDLQATVVQAALTSKLDRTIVSDLRATAHRRDPGKGALATQVKVSVGESEDTPNERVIIVRITLKGYPDGTRPEELKGAEALFEIDVEGKGFYIWETTPEEAIFRTRDFVFLLARPVHLIVANEVKLLAIKMGYSGISPASDLPSPDDPAVQHKTLVATKAPAKAKKTAVRKKPSKGAA